MSNFAGCCSEGSTARDQWLRAGVHQATSVFTLTPVVEMRSQHFQNKGKLALWLTVSPKLARYLLKIKDHSFFFSLASFFKKKKKNSHLQSICWGIFNDLLNPKSLSRKDLHLQRLKYVIHSPFSSTHINLQKSGANRLNRQNTKQTRIFWSKSFPWKNSYIFFISVMSWLRAVFCLNRKPSWTANNESLVPAGGSSTPQARTPGLQRLALPYWHLFHAQDCDSIRNHLNSSSSC